MPTLILTPRFTEDAQALWRAAGRLGWGVHRLTNWRVPDDARTVPDPVLYLESLFGPTLAERFGLRLLEPDVDFLPTLPDEYRKRRVYRTTLGGARSLAGPAFVKPPNDKSFPAKVYAGADLPTGYDDGTPVLVAEVVEWETEFRCFVLDRRPRAMSIYLRGGELQRANDFTADPAEEADALAFVETVLADPRVGLPRAAVLDVGVIRGRGRAVVEQNAAWGLASTGATRSGCWKCCGSPRCRPRVDAASGRACPGRGSPAATESYPRTHRRLTALHLSSARPPPDGHDDGLQADPARPLPSVLHCPSGFGPPDRRLVGRAAAPVRLGRCDRDSAVRRRAGGRRPVGRSVVG